MPSSALKYICPQTPATGEASEIIPGLIWLRQPLPFSLDHINVWLLCDNQSFSIVDTGLNTKTSKSTWRNTIDTYAHGLNPDKIIVTHLHPDHSGLAGWLCKTFARPLHMTSTEYFLCRVLCADTGQPAPTEAIQFYQASGMGEDALGRYKNTFGQFGRVVYPLPQSYHRLRENDVVSAGGRDWQVLMGNGHSPEHACLFNQHDNILISGDQILPKISSIVAVWPTEPTANPLHDWLESCRRLKACLPDDVTVLPAHGEPFIGAHERLDELIEHHVSRLDKLLDHCRQPRRAIDVIEVLFDRPIDQGDLIMAVGEAIAHLNYLVYDGSMARARDSKAVDWYEVQ